MRKLSETQIKVLNWFANGGTGNLPVQSNHFIAARKVLEARRLINFVDKGQTGYEITEPGTDAL